MFNKVVLFLGAIVLAAGALAVFFGGTWESMRIGLDILGGIFLIKLCYSVVVEEKEKAREEKEMNKTIEIYFK